MPDHLTIYTQRPLSKGRVRAVVQPLFAATIDVSEDERDICVAAEDEDAFVLYLHFYRVPPIGSDGEILADDAAFRAAGERILAMSSYSIPYRDHELIRLVAVAVAAYARDHGEDCWIRWLHFNVMSGSTLLRLSAEHPDFDWIRARKEFDATEAAWIFGPAPPIHSPGSALLAALRAQPLPNESASIQRCMPGLAAAFELGDQARSASLCLISMHDTDPRGLDAFATLAQRRQAEGARTTFAIGDLVHWNGARLLEGTGYRGPMRATPIVVLRASADEPEWQGEGEEAIEKLRALAERCVPRDASTTESEER